MLISPGVEVKIIDESQYAPNASGTIPFFLVASAQNKAQPDGITVAAATTAANANKLYTVTSQRDLVSLYGTPFFYTTTNGTPIQGYELNEYGLLAAYSALGVCNQVYVLRADINLASLIGQTGRPSGLPSNGAYWLDTTLSTWGFYEWNSTTGKFTQQAPIVITDSDLISGGAPLGSLGSVGSYAVNAIQLDGSPGAVGEWFYKTSQNVWVQLGSVAWQKSWPTVTGTEVNPSFTVGDTITIGFSGLWSKTFTIPAGAGNNTNVYLSTVINNLNLPELSAQVVSGKLVLYSGSTNAFNTNQYISVSGTGTILIDVGITAGNYYLPNFFAGTSSQQPLWASSQAIPRPTGSFWLKIGSSGNGLNPYMYSFNSATRNWDPKPVVLATSDEDANNLLAPGTTPSNIPAGTIYGQYSFANSLYFPTPNAPLYFYKRIATGPTIVTGSVSNPNFTTGPYELTINVSDANNILNELTINLPDNSDATDFADAWITAAIPYTTCEVSDTGNIVLTHTLGGEIYISDIYTTGASQGQSSNFLSQAGFVAGTTPGCKIGVNFDLTYINVGDTTTTGSGVNLAINLQVSKGSYSLGLGGVTPIVVNGGGNYAVDDTVTFAGTLFGGTNPANNLICKVMAVGAGGAVTQLAYVSGAMPYTTSTCLSNWEPLDYTSNEGAPVADPVNNTNWYYSVENQVDIMVNYNGAWKGYRNQNYDSNGFPTPSGSNTTDPAGPIVSASEPTLQSDGTALAYGDIWINTSDLENYPLIYRYQLVDTEDKWVLIDNTDQTSGSGVLFEDARWATNGTTNPVNDPIPSIVSLLTSNYLDLDAPSSSGYPVGMLLFNTRRSGFNVKQFRTNYFNNQRFPDETLPTQKDAWVTISGNQSNGAPYMGRKAQRAVVVQSLRSAIDTNFDIRDENFPFTIIAAPNYPELQPNMIVLNADRGDTGFIVGDTPLRLPDSATDIQAWANNTAGAASTGEQGLVTRNTYMGLFYPSGITSDFDGKLVAVPPSHMMVRTLLRNDLIAYPWFAPAGTRRGIIDNATSLGYVSPVTGEFVVVRTRLGIRDVLYQNFINPLVFFTGQGLLNYGNKSSFNSQSALDRINVARLINYVRRNFTLAMRPFVFEPNDAFTRSQVTNTISAICNNLVALRGIYDYSVVCDDTNNDAARIDRNELYVDVAIQPVKAIEFIYVPVRILNTGETYTPGQ